MFWSLFQYIKFSNHLLQWHPPIVTRFSVEKKKIQESVGFDNLEHYRVFRHFKLVSIIVLRCHLCSRTEQILAPLRHKGATIISSFLLTGNKHDLGYSNDYWSSIGTHQEPTRYISNQISPVNQHSFLLPFQQKIHFSRCTSHFHGLRVERRNLYRRNNCSN